MVEITKILIDLKNTMKNWFYTKNEVDTFLENKVDAIIATTSTDGLMSAADKIKLNGITDSADAVSFSRNLNVGTTIGTITINGVSTDIYCNNDTHVSVDSSLSTTSTNPVQNKTVTNALNDKLSSTFTSYEYAVGDGHVLAKKIGNIVMVQIKKIDGTCSANAWTPTGAVLPTGMRPDKNIYDSYYDTGINITSDGKVQIKSNTIGYSGVYGSIFFFV